MHVLKGVPMSKNKVVQRFSVLLDNGFRDFEF